MHRYLVSPTEHTMNSEKSQKYDVSICRKEYAPYEQEFSMHTHRQSLKAILFGRLEYFVAFFLAGIHLSARFPTY